MYLKTLESLSIPGIYLHYALRKLYIEDQVRSAINNGFKQVVILGAGLDSLTVRLHKIYPLVNFIELDHPATHNLKKTIVAQLKNAPNPNLHLIPIDFTQTSIQETLSKSKCFTNISPTVFIAEGITMYLTSQQIDHLFNQIKYLSKANALFIFTYMDKIANNFQFHKATPLVNYWLRWKTEPFLWGIESAKVKDLLQSKGFVLKANISHQDLRNSYLKNTPAQCALLAKGENICVAELSLLQQSS